MQGGFIISDLILKAEFFQMTRLYAWPVKIEIFVKDRAIVAPRSFPFKFFLQFFPLVALTCCFFRSSWKPLQGALLDIKCRPLDFFCRFEITLLTLFVFGFHSRFPFVSHNETGGRCQIDKKCSPIDFILIVLT